MSATNSIRLGRLAHLLLQLLVVLRLGDSRGGLGARDTLSETIASVSAGSDSGLFGGHNEIAYHGILVDLYGKGIVAEQKITAVRLTKVVGEKRGPELMQVEGPRGRS